MTRDELKTVIRDLHAGKSSHDFYVMKLLGRGHVLVYDNGKRLNCWALTAFGTQHETVELEMVISNMVMIG